MLSTEVAQQEVSRPSIREGITLSESCFFPGYVWCSDRPDCKLGLCMRGSPEDAAQRYADGYRCYRTRGKKVIVYTMTASGQVPLQHDIVL